MDATKHTHHVVFGRRVPGCPRCTELAVGMPARKGWGAQNPQWAAQRSADIRGHDCILSRCAPVCTFGDW